MVWLSATYGIDGLVALVAGISVTATLALLMMSRFSYLSFKDIKPGHRVRYGRLLLIPLLMIFIAVDPPLVSFSLFVTYAASGPVMWLWRRSRRASR